MVTTLLATAAFAPAGLPPLRVKGANLVNPAGKVVQLKGCNVGNWLMIEFWMLGISGKPGVPDDQYSLEQLLTRRFGRDEDERLMDVYRDSWMTERDWRNIKTYGFNLVRVPFNYRLLEDDERPMRLRKDAWQWLDKAVNEAERHGLYVILDLHGAQGGQSVYDHTGRSGQNKLWSVPENLDRMNWLWTQIASRYRSRSAVVAYDTLNEPYGGQKDQIAAQFERTYRAIRTVDKEKLIFAHGYTDNFDFYGDPKAHGWHNVGFQMHYYPGLFGDAPRMKSTIGHLQRLKGVADKVRKINVPFLVGEMNVVLARTGGAPMMRRFFDAHRQYGWLTTMWSYKVVTDTGGIDGGSWGMYTNSQPARTINFETAAKGEVEAYFRSFSAQSLMPYADLRRFLTEKNPKLPPFPAAEAPRTVAPSDEVLPGWTTADIGGALKGGLARSGDEAFELYGGGDDIWGSSDSFRFLNRQVSGDFQLEVRIDGVEETQGYTKAGLMIRSSLDPNAATALLSVFPSGEAQIAVRESANANMKGTDAPKVSFPGARFRIERTGSSFTFFVNGKEVGRKDLPELSGPVYVGPIALSHSNGELTKISYRDLRLTNSP